MDIVLFSSKWDMWDAGENACKDEDEEDKKLVSAVACTDLSQQGPAEKLALSCS